MMSENYADPAVFFNLNIRVGTIVKVVPAIGTKKPAYQLRIDFGEQGILQSSAQLTHRYAIEDLLGLQVVAVLNFPPKRIAGFKSECLVLGATDHKGDVVLLTPQQFVENGWPIA